MGSQKKEAILQAKWDKIGQELALTFWIALTSYFYSHLLLQLRASFQFYSALQLSSSHLYLEFSASHVTIQLCSCILTQKVHGS